MRLARPQFAHGDFGDVFLALAASNILSFSLLAARSINADNIRYWFLGWNLVLAWLPLLFAWRLSINLKKTPWSMPLNLLLTFLWLCFLPNSFYIASDLVHLSSTGEVSLLYDVAMFFSFIFNAYVVGFMSVFIVHLELLKRLRKRYAHGIIGLVFLLSGFAIYLGRFLRWNTWDLLISPAGLLFDVSERVINPSAHPQSITITLVFFMLLSAMYLVIWQLVKALRKVKVGK